MHAPITLAIFYIAHVHSFKQINENFVYLNYSIKIIFYIKVVLCERKVFNRHRVGSIFSATCSSKISNYVVAPFVLAAAAGSSSPPWVVVSVISILLKFCCS